MTYDPFNVSPPPPPPSAPPPPTPAPSLPPPPQRSPYQTPTLGYRPPGPEPKSQWWTDEDAYAGCMIYGLLGLTIIGAIVGTIWWLVAHFFAA